MEKTIEIPEGYAARIEGNKVILEPKESEDERIKKDIITTLSIGVACNESALHPGAYTTLKEAIAYLERQKEQRPAEWSEEFLRLMGITISQDGNQVCVLLGENLAEGIAGFGDTLADAVEEFKKEWRQFDRFRKATWKPSEEQMKALEDAFRKDGGNEYRKVINSLYRDLEKLL